MQRKSFIYIALFRHDTQLKFNALQLMWLLLLLLLFVGHRCHFVSYVVLSLKYGPTVSVVFTFQLAVSCDHVSQGGGGLDPCPPPYGDTGLLTGRGAQEAAMSALSA